VSVEPLTVRPGGSD